MHSSRAPYKFLPHLSPRRAAGLRAVLFDFDGTLVDSEPLQRAAWLQARVLPCISTGILG